MRQEAEEKYYERYWLMTHACVVLSPNLKAGTSLTAEQFIGDPPNVKRKKEKAKVEGEPQEEDMLGMTIKLGLLPPGMITEAPKEHYAFSLGGIQ